VVLGKTQYGLTQCTGLHPPLQGVFPNATLKLGYGITVCRSHSERNKPGHFSV
jgi:hypothetical protein